MGDRLPKITRGLGERLPKITRGLGERLPKITRATSARHAPGSMGDRLLKVAVVVLCTINAAMWEVYTESTVMAVLWAGVAVAFVIWIGKDMKR